MNLSISRTNYVEAKPRVVLRVGAVWVSSLDVKQRGPIALLSTLYTWSCQNILISIASFVIVMVNAERFLLRKRNLWRDRAMVDIVRLTLIKETWPWHRNPSTAKPSTREGAGERWVSKQVSNRAISHFQDAFSSIAIIQADTLWQNIQPKFWCDHVRGTIRLLILPAGKRAENSAWSKFCFNN